LQQFSSDFDFEIGSMQPVAGHDGSKIRIYSYCSSETDIRRVVAESIREKGSTNNTPVAATYEKQKEPFSGDIEAISLRFSLEDRQLVSVGIIVERTLTNGTIKYYLCDPQIGNGPPGTTFTAAIPLLL
jgi:hypothetical protein